MKKIIAIFLIAYNSSVYAQSYCIDLRNIEFQKVDMFKFLATRDGKNIAFISIDTRIPDNQITFRFYADKLCDRGAESEFQMNGKQSRVSFIVPFK